MSAMARRSGMSCLGLGIDSTKKARVVSSAAARQDYGSVGSATHCGVMPKRVSVYLNRLNDPPYRLGETATESPAPARLRIDRVIALWPEASSRPAAPPSSAAMRSSTTAWVGLVMRV